MRTPGRLAATAAATALLVACTGSTEPQQPSPEPTTTPPATPTTPAEPTTTPPAEPTAQHGVAAGDPAAVAAGMSVLDAGGNAVDAAVATAFAVAVVEPYASGIGGGGAAVVVPQGQGGSAVAYDYREVVADDGAIPASGTGIPGFVAGLARLHEEHGEAEWAELLAPAITLAEEGHPASALLAVRLREDVGPGIVAEHPHFATGGRPLAEGDPLVQADLADTMRELAHEGADTFYTGRQAQALAAVPGIDAGSLAGYEVVRGEPVRGDVGAHEVLAPMPPLPGVSLVQMLQVAQGLDVAGLEPGSAQFVDRVSRAWQVADETTSDVVGDPAFVDVPVDRLTDPARNAEIADGLAPSSAAAGASGLAGAAGNTTHISVVDAEGTTVSMTNTLTHWFGSARYHAGYFLNDQLTRFDSIGTTAANEPAPGRRSVSWSLPLVVLDDAARPVLAIGSPGGRLIPNVLTAVLARWAWHDEPLDEAVAAPRFHLEGDTVRVEESFPAAVADELRAMGYRIEVVPDGMYAFGSVNALAIEPRTGELAGAADPRRHADVAVAGP